MRLETESTVATPHVSDETAVQDHTGDVSAEVKSMLGQGIKAAQAGNRGVARIALQRTTELDPGNESAWLWLASISEYPEELLEFLNRVLAINPDNQRATEWKAATHALLAKTFVQRGIDACDENQKAFGSECFQKALQYDETNVTAYTWMASLAEGSEEKIRLLQTALEIDPNNDSVMTGLVAARQGVVKERLEKAKSAVVAGNNADAIQILDQLLEVAPDSIEAWMMKSHLTDVFDEKIRCFESILAIDPENLAARSGRDSLLSIFGTADTNQSEEQLDFESTEETGTLETFEVSVERSPTQDLEMPEAFVNGSFHTTEQEQTTPDEANGSYTIENVAEPFASYAEEIQEPSHVDFASVSSFEASEQPLVAETGPEAAERTEAAADPYAETVAYSYETPDSADSLSSPSSEFEIPMPASDLPVPPSTSTGFETTVEARDSVEEPSLSDQAPNEPELVEVRPESIECMFCHAANEPQSISCSSCMAVLTLSDLELLLANQSADKLILRQAVEDMERQRSSGEATVDELVALGLGHLNLRNLKLGYTCLSDASRLDPNNVVLGGQVNSLLIRLEEIKLQEEAHLKMPKGKMILVVDDSPTVRKLIAGKLEKSGHDVVCANDGVEAMEQLETMVPDLILLDITMPRMDGYQACKNIRSKSSTKDVPIVMISGKDGFFDKVRGRMAGTTGYITKPFGPETLMKAVEMYLAGEAPDLDDEV